MFKSRMRPLDLVSFHNGVVISFLRIQKSFAPRKVIVLIL